MNTARFKILPAFVMFEFSSDNALLCKRLLAAILDDACPDFECSLGSPSGKGNSYTALWRVEHAEAVRAWAQSIGLSILNTDGAPSPQPPEVSETSSTHIQLPDIGDIAPGMKCEASSVPVTRIDLITGKGAEERTEEECPDCRRIAEEDGDILPPACFAHGGPPEVSR